MRTRISGLVLILAVLLLAVAPASAAIDTLEFASFGDGIVRVTFDYNTNTGNVTKFTCTNNSDYPALFRVLEGVGGTLVLRYERVCGAHDVVTQNVAGLTLTWDVVNGGLNMGPYQFQARWPDR